ncbi:MAG: hypothetical protein WC562_00020 [Dehalococcoidia bacterium]
MGIGSCVGSIVGAAVAVFGCGVGPMLLPLLHPMAAIEKTKAIINPNTEYFFTMLSLYAIYLEQMEMYKLVTL